MTEIEPFPVVAPMVLPVTVPMLTSPAAICMADQTPQAQLFHEILVMVLFWTLVAAPVPTFR